MIAFLLNTAKDLALRLIKVGIPLAIADFLLGMFFPYAQALAYHVIVGLRIMTSPFLHGETAQAMVFILSIYHFSNFIKFVYSK